MDVGHTRAWARGRRSGPISTICRRPWQYDNATGAVALLQSGCALPARGHGDVETYLSTGAKATYRNRNAVAENRATSAYNSCRNRNCPKCRSLARAQWLADRQAELLDVPYFHVVFTVPDEVAIIAFQNKPVVYDILFHAAAETLRRIAADPAHLGAEIGFLGVLHTWGQALLHHPHLHCLVPGGGIWRGSEAGIFGSHGRAKSAGL